jgi:choice-of-anchor C domain-containing protein
MKNLFLGLVLSLAAGSAGAATVQNGGFESPGTFSGNFQTIGAGSTSLTGWTIERGSVDLINTHWQSGSGKYSLDLNGNAPATISQTISDLTIGKSYRLSFLLAGNPDGGPPAKSVGVSIGGSSPVFGFSTNGKSRGSMGWTETSFVFNASAASTVLRFSSLNNGAFGPALDNVAISPVPLPAGAPLLLAGLGAFALMRRRARRQTTA